MKVRETWVHEEDRRGMEVDGFIDLDLLAGQTVRVSTEAASQILGTTRPTLRKMIALELLKNDEPVEFRAGVTTHWVLLDPAETRRSLYTAWIARLGIPRSHLEFDRYLRVRGVCLIPQTELPPPNILEGMLPFLIQLGGSHHGEVGAFTPTHPDTESELRRLISRENSRMYRRRLPKGARPTQAMVLAAAPALRDAPGTCFEQPFGADDFAKPTDTVLRQVWEFGPLREAALLWVHLAAASFRRSVAVGSSITYLRLLDDALRVSGPETNAQDPEAVTAAFELIAQGDGVRLTDNVRARACLAICTMIRDLRLYAARHDPDGSRGIVATVPAQHSDRIGFTKRLRAASRDLALEGREQRKLESEEAAERFEELTQIIALRTEQIVATSEDAIAAARVLENSADGSAGADEHGGAVRYVDFSVPTTVMTAEGELLPGSQLCRWRAWRERDLWLDMATRKKTPLRQVEDDLIIRNCKIIDKDPAAFGRIVFEWRGCKCLSGERAVEPWFVSVSNSGALIAPGSMQAPQRARRHDFIVDWDVPPYEGSAAGLLNFDRTHSALWRYMVDRGRYVVPVKQFALAMRFAQLGFSAVDETLCRLSELLQMRQDSETWPISGETGKSEVSFLAIPKTSPVNPSFEPVPFGVSEELFLEADALARDVARIGGHADGILPEIECNARLADKFAEPQAWIFQFRGIALKGAEMNRFLRFLLANVVNVTFHDLRHASANAAECAGVPLASLQRLMNHRMRRMTVYYVGRSKGRQEAVEDQVARRRRERMIRVDARTKPVVAGFDI